MSNILKASNTVFGGNGYVFGVPSRATFITTQFITNLGKSPYGIAVDPIGVNDRYLVGYTDGSIDVFRLSTNEKVATYTGLGGSVTSIVFDPVINNNKVFIIAGANIKILDSNSFAIKNTIPANASDISFYDNNNLLVSFSGNPNGTIALYNSTTLQPSKSYPSLGDVYSAIFDPVFKRILVTNAYTGQVLTTGTSISAVSPVDGSLIKRISGLWWYPYNVHMSPNNDIYAAVVSTTTPPSYLYIFSNTNDSGLMTYTFADLMIRRLCFNNAGNKIYLTGTNGTIAIATLTYS